MTENKYLNLQNMQKFFELDLKIKDILLELAPDKNYIGNIDYVVKLNDKMYEKIDDIKFYLEKILSDFDLKNYNQHLNNLINQYKNEIAEAGTDFNKLEKFYKNCLADMDINLVQKTAAACKGYCCFTSDESYKVLATAKTINEFLHVVHSNILNNNDIYEQMPFITEYNDYSYNQYKLYGIDSEIARNTLQTLVASVGIGCVDVLGINENHVIAMIRDKGHALMIDINKTENDLVNIKYHIPKICNLEMIQSLKGIEHVNDDLGYAKGNFDVDEKHFGLELLSFVSNVPEDGHMHSNAEHYTITDIFQKMDFVSCIDFITMNPVIHEMYDMKTYIPQKYEYDLYMLENKITESITNNASVDKMTKLASKAKNMRETAMNLGITTKEQTNNNIEINDINRG